MQEEAANERQSLKSALDEDGVRAAIVRLNSLSAHRFTSLFRFDSDTLRSITFFDRENPDVETCDDVPVQASYCVFVRNSARTFTVQDAGNDERVDGHPKQQVVQRYCGVPVEDILGKLIGTICHFDFVPGPISNRDIELLEHMALLLRPKL